MATTASEPAPTPSATQSLEARGQHDIASHSGAAFFCNELVKRQCEPSRLLVAGCGAGHEAAAIAHYFGNTVDAVDIEDFVPDALKGIDKLHYQVASVCDLPFEDQSFDAIFYHHVIEHVEDPQASLVELSRVLTADGILFVGTPNRNRLFSSVGAHQQSEWESTVFNKVMDNLWDWFDRCRGKFRNECGAHAGFTKRELDGMLGPLFSERTWVTEEYLRYKYADHRLGQLIRTCAQRPWSEVLAPSIYVFAQR